MPFTFPNASRSDRVYQAALELLTAKNIPIHLPVYSIHEYGPLIQDWLEEKYPHKYYVVVKNTAGFQEYISMCNIENRKPLTIHIDNNQNFYLVIE